MKIDVLFDKERVDASYEAGWGLSFLVDGTFLFDAGEKFSYVENNARRMNLALSGLKEIFISHQHWDHIGGLEGILKENSGINVWGCSHCTPDFKEQVKSAGGQFKDVKMFTQIGQGMYSSGESMTNYKGKPLYEHALVAECDEGLVVLCGCAHPGVVNMLEKIKATMHKEIVLVAGGLHLIDKEKRFVEYIVEQLSKLTRKIAPSHCSGFEGISVLKRVFGDNCIEVKAGATLEV